jgi:serine/threonine-protein kinase
MAKKCPKCQSDNPGTAAFCADCGTQLPSLQDIEVTETMETPKEELTTGSTFAGRYQIIEELGRAGWDLRSLRIKRPSTAFGKK